MQCSPTLCTRAQHLHAWVQASEFRRLPQPDRIAGDVDDLVVEKVQAGLLLADRLIAHPNAAGDASRGQARGRGWNPRLAPARHRAAARLRPHANGGGLRGGDGDGGGAEAARTALPDGD